MYIDHWMKKIILSILILAVVFYVKGGLIFDHSQRGNQQEIEKNRAIVASYEQENTIYNGSGNGEMMLKDEETIREGIRSIDISTITNEHLISQYQRTMIVGDSIAEAMLPYGYLNSSIVQARIGATLDNADDLFDKVISNRPQRVVLCFGLNDMVEYQENVSEYIETYNNKIDGLKKDNPQIQILILSILPIQSNARISGKQYLADYNNAISTMCEQQQIRFVDASFILNDNPSLYDEDGIHPKKEFYPRWLLYIAEEFNI
jgi:hypothetical protein